MIEVTDLFKEMAQKYYRSVDFKIVSNDDESTVYSGDVILECQINRSVGSSGIQIGNAISDRLQFTLKSTDKIKSGTRLTPYVRYTGEENTEWLRLGRFYCTESKMSNGIMTVTAYDKLYNFDKRCAFGGKGDIQALSFPATHQQMWDYVCALRGVSTDFQCADFTVAERPLANPNANDDSKYYTQRQIIGMIAACNGGNAVIDNNGKLTVRQFGNQTYTLNKNRCFTQEIDTAEQFQVKGILFHVDSENDIFIDDSEGDYSEDLDGIIVCDNALATVGVAEYVWNKLGNLTYSNCEITRRGVGWLETGETLQVEDFYDTEGGAVNVITSEIDYKFSYDNGFTETIRSIAETAEQSGNRAVSGNISGSSSIINLSEKLASFLANEDGSYTINEVTYKPFFNSDSKIFAIADSEGNAIATDPTYADINSNVEFNTLFLTLASSLGIKGKQSGDCSIYEFNMSSENGLTLVVNEMSDTSATGCIIWGDGTSEYFDPTVSTSHTYAEPGTYFVKVIAPIKNLLPWLSYGNTNIYSTNRQCLIGATLADNIESLKAVKPFKEPIRGVFTNCQQMEYINLGSKVDYIGQSTFVACPKLKSFVSPKEVTLTFGTDTFALAHVPRDIVLYSVLEIPKSFHNGSSYTLTVFIGKDLTSIQSRAFWGGNNLIINYQGSEEEWEAVNKADDWYYEFTNVTINFNQIF